MANLVCFHDTTLTITSRTRSLEKYALQKIFSHSSQMMNSILIDQPTSKQKLDKLISWFYII